MAVGTHINVVFMLLRFGDSVYSPCCHSDTEWDAIHSNYLVYLKRFGS